MSEAIRVLLADDHAVLRSGLRLLIEKQPGVEVVGEAGDGDEALARVKALKPDLVLLDINMPGLDGLSALPRIRQESPNSRVLMLTMHDDVSYLQEALRAGAAGYVLKRAVDNELLMAIQAVMRGETYVHSAMTQKLMESYAAPPVRSDGDPWATLSEREYDVMRRVALGYTNGEIADELHLSVKTVESYRARGMEKLELETRAQVVQSALKHGHLDQ